VKGAIHSTKYNAIVIGSGQSGPSLTARLTKESMQVAIAKWGLFGGTCVNTGCIPTKTLVPNARTAYDGRRAEDYDVMIGVDITVDMKKVKARMDDIRGASKKCAEGWLKTMENCTVHEWQVRFEGPGQISVGDDLIDAKMIFINVGGLAAVPDIPGLESLAYMTNTAIMEVDFLPEHLLVLGGSYIGLEFGQRYHRFGSKVTIIWRGKRLIAREDEDVSNAVREIIEAEDINILADTSDVEIEKRGDKIAVNVGCKWAHREAVGSHLLVATAQVPNG
jgi:pyruvate/2-oxoglutarate dehydrogenase complex dihydrolipoamide dehydrogenase (E3) component